MKKYRFEIVIAIVLTILALLIYYLHVLIFHDLHHLIIYGLEDLAFLPLEVLLVTLVLDRLLELRDRNDRNSKINMIVGSYFSEIGNVIFRILSDADLNKNKICNSLDINSNWRNKEFKDAVNRLKKYNSDVKLSVTQIKDLKEILYSKRELLINLTQNPALLEYASFSDLLLATFHLTDELSYRENIAGLPKNDIEHITLDAKRVYDELIMEWLKYMKHLKNSYPYLYSMSCRTNPFNERNNVIFK